MKRLACAIAFALTLSGAPDVLQQLGIPRSDAGMSVLNALASGSPDHHRVRSAFKAASPAARGALVEQLLVWTKAYVNSPQFAKDYAAYREQAKPSKPEFEGSVEQELARQRKEQEQQLAEAKASLKEMPAELRKEMETSIRELEKTFREMQSNTEVQAGLREGIEMQRAGDLQNYEEQLATWREEYPADPKELVKQRLEQFLEVTEGVDFEAKLVKNGSKMRFANEEYEDKSSEWKLAYRAGKPATDAARTFAKTWLGEL